MRAFFSFLSLCVTRSERSLQMDHVNSLLAARLELSFSLRCIRQTTIFRSHDSRAALFQHCFESSLRELSAATCDRPRRVYRRRYSLNYQSVSDINEQRRVTRIEHALINRENWQVGVKAPVLFRGSLIDVSNGEKCKRLMINRRLYAELCQTTSLTRTFAISQFSRAYKIINNKTNKRERISYIISCKLNITQVA